MSGVEPAPNGTMIFTVLAGQSCASPGMAAAVSSTSASMARLNTGRQKVAAIGVFLCPGTGLH